LMQLNIDGTEITSLSTGVFQNPLNFIKLIALSASSCMHLIKDMGMTLVQH
jgi:hypothetical protein